MFNEQAILCSMIVILISLLTAFSNRLAPDEYVRQRNRTSCFHCEPALGKSLAPAPNP